METQSAIEYQIFSEKPNWNRDGGRIAAVRVYLTFKGILVSCKSLRRDILSCYQVSL